MKFPNLFIHHNFYLFPSDGSEVVLGLEWLDTLEDVVANFRESRLIIEPHNAPRVLQGDPELCYGGVALQPAMRVLEEQGHGFLVQLWPAQQLGDMGSNILEEISQVLAANEVVFQALPGLPPPQHHDHAITLKVGADIPNLRPYRYPHYQKNEIDKLVSEMLTSGIIRPSINPFASPIILVKKKDGSLRFCIDYRALNKITVPDKFPIPVIDELLDELVGATIFSKLDLKSGYHQIRMVEEDIRKTAFQTHEGHYSSCPLASRMPH